MSLHGARAAALLAWVNSAKVCPEPLQDLAQLRDCCVFVRIINKIHRSEEGEAVLEQPLQERISFIHSFLQKHCKHRSAAGNLLLAQQLLDGEELALAKVAVLLLYHTSISCKSPGDWDEFDYKTQVELASILKFVLDNEESLDENLEPFLQRKAAPSPGSSSEENSPLLSLPPKREVRFLELQKIASSSSSSSSSTNNIFCGPPASPMGDVMQTPQFQLRRLKKQLAAERENRDELEVELAENRKLVTEKEAQITMMQQRIDRLVLLNEKQAADQLEPKEMEELREKNESLVLRLHEALKQCQDLKTEKGQMDRKINQLSEENGDLSFKLREIGSHLVQLQEALNELSEEHNTALAQAQEKQGQLESELCSALQEKKCSEEKVEILQGKVSLLEDQLAKLEDSSTQEKGEILGDVLKLEELKQEVSNLSTQGAELQATIQRLEQEKQQREAALQSQSNQFEAEKQELGVLVASLQGSLAESRRAGERLEQELRDTQGHQERSLRERDTALEQLQLLRDTNAALSGQLEALARARDASEATSAMEKAELSRRVGELESRVTELGGQGAQLRELEGRLRDSQQKVADREKLARENARLQERLLFLEESLRNTEGILEDEKRRAAESLEGSLARIAQLEMERQQLEMEKQQLEQREQPTGASQGEEEMQALSREHGRTCQRLQAEQEKVATLEAQVGKHQEQVVALQAELCSARARAKEQEGEEQKLRAEVSSLREKAAGLEVGAQRASQALEDISQQLSREKLRSKELEGAVERLRSTEAELSRVATGQRQRELELEGEVKKLSGEVMALGTRLEETLREHRRELGRREEEMERLRQEVERAKGDGATERSRKAELEVQLQNTLNEQRVERSARREELGEKERELEELRQRNLSLGQELRDLQETVTKLKGEVASAKEQVPKVDKELQGSSEATRSGDTEGDSVQAACPKEVAIKGLEEKNHQREQEPGSSQELLQEKLKETQELRVRVEELEQRCRGQQETAATLERATAELEASRREAAEQKEKVLELQKLLEGARAAQGLHEGAVEALRKELQEKNRELLQSKATVTTAEKEVVALRAAAQEKGRLEESWKEQVSQELERKSSLIGSLEHEVSILHRQLTEKEGESKELKRLIVAESEKSKKLEERLRVLQTEMATAASRAAERCSLMKVEVQRSQEEMEKQRLAMEALKRERHCQGKREEELRQEAKVLQDKCLQKEQLLAALQQELGGAQALAGELPALKHLCQQLQAERSSMESQHRQDMEQRGKALAALQAEVSRAKLEVAEAAALRERWAEQERALRRLQEEAVEAAARLEGLQQSNTRLVEENQGLSQARERHTREMERLRAQSQEVVAGSRLEAEEAARKLEEMRKELESSKAAALEERRKLLEERQRLTAQVEQLEVSGTAQAKQLEELTKKLSQHEKATRTQQQRVKVLEGELQAEATRQKEKVAELQAQLAQKEQAAEHYKGQMEKAKTHYDAKKQQSQELVEKLKAMEQLQEENVELRGEAERLAKELEQSVLRAQESELSCRNLSSQVRSLEAQVEFANRQLQDLGGFPGARKGRGSPRQPSADLSTDSLDLSLDEAQPLNSTRKPGRSHSEASVVPPESPRRLPRRVESLESLYFTPIPPPRTRSGALGGLQDTGGALGGLELPLGSGCRTRSARRRNTSTLSTKQPKAEEPDSTDGSFCSIGVPQPPAKSRLRSATSGHSLATSGRSLATFPSQESLPKLDTSSPGDTPRGDAGLRGLPGYRPVTRSSLRLLQGSTSLGRSSLYLGPCQDEPEPPDEWGRIAELQQRNRACPPHLKSCYPLESRPSNALGTVTDEELKTGDPRETLRRASIQPPRATRGATTGATTLATSGGATGGATGVAPSHSSTLGPTWPSGIATRQQRKRRSDESHQGPETPEPKKPPSCFPRPQTPRERRGPQPRRGEQQAERRQSLAFSILNTPKKLGSSLLRRAQGRKGTPRGTPRGSPRASTRRSPRASATKAPKAKPGRRALKDTKF